jgi:hypothetical protein
MAQHGWRVHIQPSDRPQFKYRARCVPPPSISLLEDVSPAYLYGEGDLAVFLEDRGANRRAIEALLDSDGLTREGTADIPIEPSSASGPARMP